MPLHFHFISAVHIWFISYIINTHFFHGNIWTHNWPAPNVSGFIAQLVEHRTGNREVTGSNPVEVLNLFQASLRDCINCVHCDDHFFISINTYFSLKAKRWLRGGVGGHVGVSTNPVGFELFSYVTWPREWKRCITVFFFSFRLQHNESYKENACTTVECTERTDCYPNTFGQMTVFKTECDQCPNVRIL